MLKIKNREFVIAITFCALFTLVLFTPGRKQESQKTDTQVVLAEKDWDFGAGGKDFTADKNQSLNPGEYSFNSFELKNANLMVNTSAGEPSALTIRAKTIIYIDKDSSIDLSGAGYASRQPGQEQSFSQDRNYEYAGGGGSLGGNGGSGSCEYSNKALIPSSFSIDREFGTQGGVGSGVDGTPGVGGGYILLIAPEIVIDGKVMSNGLAGSGSGGGGSGGKIVILAQKLSINGSIFANGGNGGTSQIQGAGGGSGGIVMLSTNQTSKGKIEYLGGRGGQALDLYTGCSGGNGEPGKLFLVL